MVNFSENRSLSVLQKYAAEIGLDKKTGIEITESAPQVSNSYAVPSYIGQGTNAYTTSQLARYATAIATSGNVYDLTLLDRQTNSKGKHSKNMNQISLTLLMCHRMYGTISMTECIEWFRLINSLMD